MNASRARIIYHLARADFLERVRRYSFLITLGFTLYFGYLGATGRIILRLDQYEGARNAAYIGGFMAYVASIFLSLAGFYIVKNSIERDRQTRVGEILAATPMIKTVYCAGKFLSNLAVLLAMVGIMAVAAIAMYFFSGDHSGFRVLPLLTPFMFLAVPTMAVVSALTLIFEATGFLSSGLGNIVYFFLWNGLLSLGLVQFFTQTPHPFLDWTGGFTLDASLSAAVKAAYPGATILGFQLTVGHTRNAAIHVFQWNGFHWTTEILLSRLFWLCVAIGLTFFGSVIFDRFDPARGRLLPGISPKTPLTETRANGATSPVQTFSAAQLAHAASRFRFGTMVIAELRLMLKGLRWWWCAVALGLIIAEIATPIPAARNQILIFAWIWPVLLWSAMGTRETQMETAALVFSSAHSLKRQLPAAWLAGVLVTFLAGSGCAIHLLISGDYAGMFAWLVGALFIPTLALALGVWSGTSKFFEIVYLLLWYIGPLHAVWQLDYMGVAPAAIREGMPKFYLAATLVLAAVALAGRRRQLQA